MEISILAPHLTTVGDSFLEGMVNGADAVTKFTFNPDTFTRKLVSVGNNFFYASLCKLGGIPYRQDLSFKFDELVVAGGNFLRGIYNNPSV